MKGFQTLGKKKKNNSKSVNMQKTVDIYEQGPWAIQRKRGQTQIHFASSVSMFSFIPARLETAQQPCEAGAPQQAVMQITLTLI